MEKKPDLLFSLAEGVREKKKKKKKGPPSSVFCVRVRYDPDLGEERERQGGGKRTAGRNRGGRPFGGGLPSDGGPAAYLEIREERKGSERGRRRELHNKSLSCRETSSPIILVFFLPSFCLPVLVFALCLLIFLALDSLCLAWLALIYLGCPSCARVCLALSAPRREEKKG